jgi:exosome complex component RRP42
MDNLSKEYLVNSLNKGKREDGRKFDEIRKVQIENDVSNNAEGSARVKLGETEVIVGIKMEMGTPYPDNPDEGTIIVSAEMLPLSSPDFESGPPSEDSIELARVVDRAIRESGALDLKKLCVEEGEKVWLVLIDIYTINDGGNLQDAATLAALAALKDAKIPGFDGEKVDYKKKKGSLPLSELPVECTSIRIKDKILSDASIDEYKHLDARLTIATLENGDICAMQKGGEGTLTAEDIKEMVKASLKNGKILRKELK